MMLFCTGSEVHVAPKLRVGGTSGSAASSALPQKTIAGASSLPTAGLQLPRSFRVLPMPDVCLLTWQEQAGLPSACSLGSKRTNTHDDSSLGQVGGGRMHGAAVPSWCDHHQCYHRQQPHYHWRSWLTSAVFLCPSDMMHLRLQRAACLTVRSAGPHKLATMPPINTSRTPTSNESTSAGHASAVSTSISQGHYAVQQRQLQQGQPVHASSTTLQPLPHSSVRPGPPASSGPHSRPTSTNTSSSNSSSSALPPISVTVRAIPWE
eukprot:scaffold98008_cov20-Tisochrysis_lutea.AAC.4